ncbi:MAG: PAS domain S-box protein, partial [Candidatus Aminicenantales bacterium]
MESYENSRSQGHRPSAYIPHEILTEFDENYRTLVENAPDIFFIIDLKGKFLLVNKAIRRITGHSPSSIL